MDPETSNAETIFFSSTNANHHNKATTTLTVSANGLNISITTPFGPQTLPITTMEAIGGCEDVKRRLMRVTFVACHPAELSGVRNLDSDHNLPLPTRKKLQPAAVRCLPIEQDRTAWENDTADHGRTN